MKSVLPVIAFDLDGTLADYHGHFIDFSSEFFQRPPENIAPYDGVGKFRHWWCAAFRASNDEWAAVKLAYRQGAQKRSQPVIESIVDHHEYFASLARMGCEVWITTTRPYLSLDRVDKDTRFWLDYHGIDYYGLLYDDDKYQVLKERVGDGRVIAVVDDLPEMYDAAESLFGSQVPILRKTRWNTAQTRPNVFDDLYDIKERIMYNLAEWQRYHG
jgi:phosphoglycolate phosphatase-like HAD superfamily hydrolase